MILVCPIFSKISKFSPYLHTNLFNFFKLIFFIFKKYFFYSIQVRVFQTHNQICCMHQWIKQRLQSSQLSCLVLVYLYLLRNLPLKQVPFFNNFIQGRKVSKQFLSISFSRIIVFSAITAFKQNPKSVQYTNCFKNDILILFTTIYNYTHTITLTTTQTTTQNRRICFSRYCVWKYCSIGTYACHCTLQ